MDEANKDLTNLKIRLKEKYQITKVEDITKLLKENKLNIGVFTKKEGD